jgi:isopentenyl-diphosphate delta-isomerase
MTDAKEHVVLVDAKDRELGTAPKLAAHREARLHRAFSVLIRGPGGRLLLQKRHIGKYHSGGLWTNACCGHPRPGEAVAAAARRRLAEEMGLACEIAPLGVTRYRAELGGGMTEHEVVHLFAGVHDGPVRPDPREADGYAWLTAEELRADLMRDPARYTAWFRVYAREFWSLLTSPHPAA